MSKRLVIWASIIYTYINSYFYLIKLGNIMVTYGGNTKVGTYLQYCHLGIIELGNYANNFIVNFCSKHVVNLCIFKFSEYYYQPLKK